MDEKIMVIPCSGMGKVCDSLCPSEAISYFGDSGSKKTRGNCCG